MGDITSLMRKLQSLASDKNDNEHERNNARAKLEALIEEYGWGSAENGYKFDDVDQCKYMHVIWGVYSSKHETLLNQIQWKVTGDRACMLYKHSCNKARHIETTREQFLLIAYLYKFYVKAWQEEMELLFEAFIQKHRLFGESPPGERTKLDDESYNKLFKMVRALSDREPQTLLENKPLRLEHKS